MPLTDPELDLLRELLADDPSEDVFAQVGEELVRRGIWAEAVTVLRGGLAAHPEEVDSWAMLARAALEVGDHALSLEAWERAGADLQKEAELSRVRILALERSGRLDEARRAVDAFELDHLDVDVVIEAVKERIEAPPPVGGLAAADPFVTVRAAERYVAAGRPDRAVRIYRRVLFHNPGDAAIASRLVQLQVQHPWEPTEDLSEELDDPNLVPPDLRMPAPAIGSASLPPAPGRTREPPAAWDNAVASAAGANAQRARLEPLDKPAGLADFLANVRAAERRSNDFDADDDTDDITSPLPGLSAVGLPASKRKRKRSLLNR